MARAGRIVFQPIAVRVNERYIEAKFMPMGDAARFLDRRMQMFLVLSKSLAPSRSGMLKASIRKSGTLNRGRYAAGGTLHVDVPWAGFVVHGTRDGIRANASTPRRGTPPNPMKGGLSGLSQAMPIPVGRGIPRWAGGSGPFVFARSVRGQRANPFIDFAAARAFTGTRPGIVIGGQRLQFNPSGGARG